MRPFYIGFCHFYFPKWQHTRAGASAKTKLASTHQDYYGCVISHYDDVCTKNILKILGPEGPEERMHNQLHTQTCCTHIVLHAATDPLRLHTQTETGAKVAETSQFKWGFCARCCCMLLPFIYCVPFSCKGNKGTAQVRLTDNTCLWIYIFLLHRKIYRFFFDLVSHNWKN